MPISTIQIEVKTDEQNIAEEINWESSASPTDAPLQSKAMLLAFWDANDQQALKLDLWTKSMMVDEMTDFYFQTLVTMADTYQRATKYDDMADSLKQFAHSFYKTFRDKQKKEAEPNS